MSRTGEELTRRTVREWVVQLTQVEDAVQRAAFQGATTQEVELAEIERAVAAELIAHGVEDEDGVDRRLSDRAVVARAQGILMERHHLTERTAPDWLVATSRRTRRPVEGGRAPGPHRHGPRRGSRGPVVGAVTPGPESGRTRASQ